MRPIELVAMDMAAVTVARWIREWGLNEARLMVIEHMSGIHEDNRLAPNPAFRAAYLTAFGR